MDRMPSDNLDQVLAALARMEYRDFVGIKPKLAEALIKVMNMMTQMLEYEIKSRTIEKFAFPSSIVKSDDGAFM